MVYVVLFGSAARSCSYRDVDLAILFQRRPGVDELLDLVSQVADRLGLSDDRVDTVVLNREDLSCTLIVEALGRGVPVYHVSWEVYVEDALRRLWICWDFEIASKKLGLVEAAVEAVKSRWVS